MAVLFLVFAAALAMGTFVETWYSTETARIFIYNTTWFEVIMVFFVIVLAASEAAIGLSIIIGVYRNFGNILTDKLKGLRG